MWKNFEKRSEIKEHQLFSCRTGISNENINLGKNDKVKRIDDTIIKLTAALIRQTQK